VEDEAGVQKSYRIVGIDEADPARGAVSWISPLAKALLGSRAGDVVTLRSPQGEEDLEIVSVAYSSDPC
jgi:transcription elongation factor GreB